MTSPVPVSGDSRHAALRALYDAHWIPLVRLARLLLGGSAHAEEIVQDAFVATYHRMDRILSDEATPAYLRRCVVNGCRSAGRHAAVELRHRQPGAPPVEPSDLAIEALEHDAVMTALRALPQRQREVLTLRYFLDLSQTQIADALGMSVGAVKTHAHRGISTLRADLTGGGSDD